jgi:hypothetical protein
MACIRSNIRANSAGAVSTATAELPLSRVDFPSLSLTNDVFVLFIYFSRNAPGRQENGEGSSETHLISRDEVTSNSIRDPRQIRESIQPDAFLFCEWKPRVFRCRFIAFGLFKVLLAPGREMAPPVQAEHSPIQVSLPSVDWAMTLTMVDDLSVS